MARYEQGRGPYFVQVPFELLQDGRVDAIAVSTYCAIKMHADFGQAIGSRVSDRRGAELAHCSERAFRDRRALLAELGWIEWEQVPGKANRYLVHNSPAVDNPFCEPGPRQDVPGSGVPSEPHPGTTCRGGRHHVPGYPDSEKSPENPAPRAENPGDSSEDTPAPRADDRYNREPLPKQTPSAAGAAGADGGGEEAPSWSSRACAAWQEIMGGPPPGGRIGRALKPLVANEAYGGVETVLAWWGKYLRKNVGEGRASYATPEDFASRYGQHVQNGGAASGNGRRRGRAQPTAQDYGTGDTEAGRWKQ